MIKSDIGKIFGGYCKIGFKSQIKSEYKIDNNCFLFSVDLKKIYPAIENKDTIRHIPSSYGLCFSCSLAFYDEFMNNKKNFVCSKNNGYFTGLTNDYEMNNEQQYFKCKDLEIFQIK